MLDNRIYTFLKLCEFMNYRATAEALMMTQPAVTQHIQSLEREYGCKLFLYNNKTLSMTDNATRLRQCCESALYNEIVFRKYISAEKKKSLRIGATKTIGNYSIDNKISRLLMNENIKLSIVIDNTKKLLEMLDNALLDFALVEGYFDKNKYAYKLMKNEEFVGISSKSHPLAGKTVKIEDIKNETVIIREPGSGTREVFERILTSYNYSMDCFDRVSNINSFELIKKCVAESNAITFGYKTIAESDDRLTYFYFSDRKIYHEFNFVYLKDSLAEEVVRDFLGTEN